MRTVVMLLVAGALAAGCAPRGDGPPEIVLDRTACSRCRMLVSEPIHAAALRVPGAPPQAFDDIGCLLAVLREHGPDASAWVHDAAGRGWIDATSAVFVTGPSLRTPMHGSVVAFQHAADAEAYARTHTGAQVTSLARLLATAGARP